MKRKIYDKLVKWKNESKGSSAILIEGARRVGKTYIATKFAKENYKTYILIDFNNVSKEIKNIFRNYLDNLNYFFMYISEFYGISLYERNTAFIFDNVQMFPRAREAIKTLVADGRYDYIETGKCVSIHKNVKDILIPSEEEKLEMNPLDFEEFLWAMGNNNLMDFIRECYKEKKPVTEPMHKKTMDYFKKYLIVGGMPEAIEEFIKTKDFMKVDKVKRKILNSYIKDIDMSNSKLQAYKTKQVYKFIPKELQKHEKKFKLADINQKARYRDYRKAFIYLREAKIINIAYNTTEPNIGLGQRLDSNMLKCYMADTGLLLSATFNEQKLVDEKIYRKILFDKLDFNEGMIMENIVAQMLVASGRKLYFFSNYDHDNSSNTMEIDFLISKNDITSKHNIIPIEVKSGSRYTYSSLEKLEKKYKDYLAEPIILHPQDLKEENGILYLPLYMTSLL